MAWVWFLAQACFVWMLWPVDGYKYDRRDMLGLLFAPIVLPLCVLVILVERRKLKRYRNGGGR